MRFDPDRLVRRTVSARKLALEALNKPTARLCELVKKRIITGTEKSRIIRGFVRENPTSLKEAKELGFVVSHQSWYRLAKKECKARNWKVLDYESTDGRSRAIYGGSGFRAVQHATKITPLAWVYRNEGIRREDSLREGCDFVIPWGTDRFLGEFDNNTEKLDYIEKRWAERYDALTDDKTAFVLVIAETQKRLDQIRDATPYLHPFCLYGLLRRVCSSPYGRSYRDAEGRAQGLADVFSEG